MEHLIPHVKGPMSTHPTNSSDRVMLWGWEHLLMTPMKINCNNSDQKPKKQTNKTTVKKLIID